MGRTHESLNLKLPKGETVLDVIKERNIVLVLKARQWKIYWIDKHWRSYIEIHSATKDKAYELFRQLR